MKTALELMRSRYEAFVRGDVAYLLATHHPDTRPKPFTTDTIYTGLTILSTSQGGERDKIGKVEFVASYMHDGKEGKHHELSRFKRYKGEWMYLDGKVF